MDDYSVTRPCICSNPGRLADERATQAKIYQPGNDDVVAPTAQPDQSIPPKTAGAKQAKYNGIVLLNVVIGIDGTVTQTKVVKSANPDLDKKAAELASRWSFVPARKKGLPVPSTMPIEIDFHLY